MQTSHAPSPPATPAPAGPRTAEELFRLSQMDLYDLFRLADPGPIPVGRGRGMPIAFPGTPVSLALGKALATVIWRGKTFDAQKGDLKNLLSVLGVPGIRAVVYRQESWFDARECTVLDYSQTSRVAGWIRDEIRQVSPGLYLGLVYGVGSFFGGRRLLDLHFCLDFSAAGGR